MHAGGINCCGVTFLKFKYTYMQTTVTHSSTINELYPIHGWQGGRVAQKWEVDHHGQPLVITTHWNDQPITSSSPLVTNSIPTARVIRTPLLKVASWATRKWDSITTTETNRRNIRHGSRESSKGQQSHRTRPKRRKIIRATTFL